MKPEKQTQNIMLLGNNRVGKTSIVNSLRSGLYPTVYKETILPDFNKITKQFKEVKYIFNIWEAKASEPENLLIPVHRYKLTDNFIIVLSFDNKSSLDSLVSYLNLIYNTRYEAKYLAKVSIIINKNDINNKKFTIDEVKNQLKSWTKKDLIAKTIDEMSVRDNQSDVVSYFRNLALIFQKEKKESKSDSNRQSISLKPKPTYKKIPCC